MKSENPYKVAYAQYTTKTVAPHISTTNVVEIERHQDNIGNGMRATGEFVHSAFDWVAEHPVETVGFGLVTVGGFIVYSTGIGEIATIITAIFTGIATSLR